jgi:hypothetical protein
LKQPIYEYEHIIKYGQLKECDKCNKVFYYNKVNTTTSLITDILFKIESIIDLGEEHMSHDVLFHLKELKQFINKSKSQVNYPV